MPLGRTHRILLAAGIWGLAAAVGLLDLRTSAQLIGSILFTVPLALCAVHRSKRLLWSIGLLAALLTMAAEPWGIGRVGALISWDAVVSRGLLVVSLLTLTTFIHLWLSETDELAVHVAQIARQSQSLVSQNAHLESLMAEAALEIEARKAAEKYLAGLESRASALLEAAPDAMIVVDANGIIVLLNAQAEKLYGYERNELLASRSDILTPERFRNERQQLHAAFSADAPATRLVGDSAYGLRRDGSEFPIEASLSPLESPDGLLIIAAVRDLSGRKAADLHLAQMEARYRGLLEAAPDATVVVNQGGEIVLLNVQAEKRFGYRRDELIGHQVKRIIPEGFEERLIAESTRTAADALTQQIGTGIELWGRRKDGAGFPIELMLSPLENVDGVLVTVAIRDISVRKDAEKRVAQLKDWYRGLLEAAPDPMVLINQGGDIVLVNRQAENAFGYRREELIGGSARRLVSLACLDRLIAFTRRAPDGSYAEQSHSGIELDGCHKDGREFPIEATLSRLKTTDEGILLTVAIRDITTRKQSEMRLLQTVDDLNRSNEELAQFAYIASHDLQEPLRMVASYTQLLSKRYAGRLDADADEFIGYAVDGANRMQRLIQDLLAYSRVGTKGTELLPTSSQDALEQAITNLGGTIEDSGAFVTHDSLPAVLADQGQLVQLFQNLVGNAIKYQGPGIPRIHVSSVKDGQAKWMFSVQDNGLGIEPKYFERIFGMFQRLHRREEFEGTGIGLAICKKIVERHGGSLAVESALGQGATFRFALRESSDR